MSTAIATQEKAAPTTAATYILFYRQGSNPHPLQKQFNFQGGLKEAIQRGQAHCDTMNYRFIRVQPFFSNLEADERGHLDRDA